MIHALRHFTIRIWSTVLLGGFANLLILPAFRGYIGLDRVLLAACGVMVLVFVGIGWIFNRLGKDYVEYLIREATDRERDGMHYEAERAFRKAVAVFDSFLLSPIVRRKKSTHVAARLARFYLARADKDATSENFIFSYLQAHPEDEEVAENWLRQISSYGDLEKAHYELAFCIGNACPKNQTIQYLLSQFYLTEERTDFPALQTYRRVLSGDKRAADIISGKLADIFLLEGRADDWALQIYLKAYRLNPDRSDLLKGIVACVYWIKETERTRHLLKTAKQLVSGIDEERLETMRVGFNPPVAQPVLKKESFTHRLIKAVSEIVSRIGKALFELLKTAIAAITARLRNTIRLIRRSKHAKVILGRTAIIVLAGVVLVLVINTFRYLAGSEKPVSPKTEAPVVTVPDRFTIQVAAYLKYEHAKRFAETLKKQGIDAFWTKATGTKKTWYQVRVSHFPDKASAKAYGESLKARGVIDDFYVANYKRSQNRSKKSI